MSHRERARAWARTILETAWTPERFRLESIKETIPTHRNLRRPIYRAELAVWERIGVAAVSVDRGGRVRGVRFPVAPDDLAAGDPCELERVPDAARRAALAATAPAESPVRLRGASRVLDRGAAVFALTIEQRPPDGVVVVELDPASGVGLGYSVEPFLRGSTRSAALSRSAVVARAKAALDLPARSKLARAELVVTANGARVWRLRWVIDAAPGESTGFVRALVNARSGAIAGLLREVRPPLSDARPPRESSERRLAVFVEVRFGPEAHATSLVPGATKVGEAYLPCWLSAITTPRGKVIRATVVGERIELSKPAGTARPTSGRGRAA